MKYVFIGLLGYWLGSFIQFCVDESYKEKRQEPMIIVQGLMVYCTIAFTGFLLATFVGFVYDNLRR